MPSTVIVTGQIGPGNSVTSLTFTNVVSFELDTENQVLAVRTNDGKTRYFDVVDEATLTLTVSGGVYTLTIAA